MTQRELITIAEDMLTIECENGKLERFPMFVKNEELNSIFSYPLTNGLIDVRNLKIGADIHYFSDNGSVLIINEDRMLYTMRYIRANEDIELLRETLIDLERSKLVREGLFYTEETFDIPYRSQFTQFATYTTARKAYTFEQVTCMWISKAMSGINCRNCQSFWNSVVQPEIYSRVDLEVV